MKKKVDSLLLRFIEQSNLIENVTGDQAIKDSIEAWDYCMQYKQMRPIIIRGIHRRIMHHQPIEQKYKGAYRDCDVYIAGTRGLAVPYLDHSIRDWCSRVNKLFTMIPEPVKENEQMIMEMIYADHIIYESIHPHIDGNGRVGRMLLNWERVRVGLPIMVIEKKDAPSYYKLFR